MAIDITNTLNGPEEVLACLLRAEEVTFFDESHLYHIWSSDNGGWMYDIFNIEDCPKDSNGCPFLDEDEVVEANDGGLCCGTAQDAIEMAIGNDFKCVQRNVELERSCCGHCEEEEESDENVATESSDKMEKPFVYIVVRSDDACGVYGVEILESDEELQKEMDYLKMKKATLRVNNEFSDGFFRQYTYDDIGDEDKDSPHVIANTITICAKRLFDYERKTKIPDVEIF